MFRGVTSIQSSLSAAVASLPNEYWVHCGGVLCKLNIERDLPWLNLESQQTNDLARFNWSLQDHLLLETCQPAAG